jgi:uncharacterized protein (DUF1810 family)
VLIVGSLAGADKSTLPAEGLVHGGASRLCHRQAPPGADQGTLAALMDDLERFETAQDTDSGFATALRELRAGRKTSHWIWYVFPQIEGLGSSPAAMRYALASPLEAEAYLRHPVLGERLVAVTEAACQHLSLRPPAPLRTLMGSSIDALKLVSSMTLFERVARSLDAREADPRHARLAVLSQAVLDAARAQGFAPCSHTEARLRAAGYP